ncbi:MAG: efflux RND transporter periplasmic adaptor subunit, partial [candidate division NC10 bacterium]|nr:efflux RND transporter periplasmic adaptor subunit [candidate division NC10 bacterium]
MRLNFWREIGGTFLVGLLFLGALSCSRGGEPKGQANTSSQSNAKRVIPVTVAKVESRDVQRMVEAVGSLLPEEEVAVVSEASGIIEAIYVDLGDAIKKDQVLLKLDQREHRLNLERAEATLRQARARLGSVGDQEIPPDEAQTVVRQARATFEDAQIHVNRMRDLYKAGAVSRQELDNAEARFQVTQANYEAALEQVRSLKATVKELQATVDLARKKLSDTIVRAPIAGSVRERLVSAGEYIVGGGMQSTKLFTLVRSHPLKLKASVPERFAPEVRIGQAVRVEVEAYPGQGFPGRITRISPAVDVQTRSFSIEAIVPNEKGLLKPGFFAKASILTRMERAVAFVPENALVSIVGLTKVFVVVGDKVVERIVKTGLRVDGRVEIVEGVKLGE